MPKLSKKRKAHTKNLGDYAQKRQKLPLEVRLSQFRVHQADCWDSKAMEEEPIVVIQEDIPDTISEISEVEDVPCSDATTLNKFLQIAMNGMQESTKRRAKDTQKGIKGVYAVKIGQTKSRWTRYYHAQRNREAVEAGRHNGSLITSWFSRKPRAAVEESVVKDLISDSESISTSISELHTSVSSVSTPATIETEMLSPSKARSPDESGSPPIVPEPQSAETIPKPPTPQWCPRHTFNTLPPSVDKAVVALEDIKRVLKPRRLTGGGYKDLKIDLLLHGQLEMMRMFVWAYIDGERNRKPGTGSCWIAASEKVAHAAERGAGFARSLQEWTRSFLNDHKALPHNPYGHWNTSILEDEDLAIAIHLHLQGIGKYVRAMDIVHFLDLPDTKAQFNLKKTISLTTAQRWMHAMHYRWMKNPRGQFVDGHECKDVVVYRQMVFLPAWKTLEPTMCAWTKDGAEVPPTGQGCCTIIWHHDESTFYANDRRKVHWVHKDETVVPYAKGEGASLMVADFVSAEYGWLRSLTEKMRLGSFSRLERLEMVILRMRISYSK